jgi:hypothetical protein
LSGTSGALEIVENQFITLTEGDTLLELELEENATKVDNKYRAVKSASYRFASDTGNNVSNNLPQINVDESTK